MVELKGKQNQQAYFKTVLCQQYREELQGTVDVHTGRCGGGAQGIQVRAHISLNGHLEAQPL